MIGSDQGFARAARVGLSGAALVGFAWLLWRTAWLSDDAYISLRTAANWLSGHGLTWNAGERVQTFTHPLWLFALAGAHAITGEPFYSTLWLSIAVSCAAAFLLLAATPGGLAEKLTALFVLVCSRAFVDFSSSGLENPLTHLLLAAFASVYFAAPPSPQRTGWLAAVAGACALNRLDTILLVAPALATCISRQHAPRDLLRLWPAALPIACWELFSIVYYGFPFPNTAYAKLTQGEGASDRLLHGMQYALDSLRGDPLTLCAIAGCALLAARRRDTARLWLLAGAGLYIAYAISVGGDFMSGRFFSAPLFVAAFCLATSDWSSSYEARIVLTGLALALAALGTPPVFTGADYGAAAARAGTPPDVIHDERAMFFPSSSLRNARRMEPSRSDHPWANNGYRMKSEVAADPGSRVRVVEAIGYAGYYAGSRVHLVDHWALADALIARLPAVGGGFGHYPRVIPEGYVDTLVSGENRISDPRLAAYYDRLALAVRGPLWSGERLRAIWGLNTGAYDALLGAYAYVRTPRFTPQVVVRNLTDYPCVAMHVWNDGRVSSYVLDDASTRGKGYLVSWEISPAGARILSGAVAQTSTFAGLRQRGLFSLSATFSRSRKEMPREIYELRYGYSIADDQLLLQRMPWHAFNRDFPGGAWEDARSDAITVLAQPVAHRSGSAAGARAEPRAQPAPR